MPTDQRPATPTPIDTPTFITPPTPKFNPYKPPSKLIFVLFVLFVVAIAMGIGYKITQSPSLPFNLASNGNTSGLETIVEQAQQYLQETNDPNAGASVPQGSSLPDSPLNNQTTTETKEGWQTYQNPTEQFSLSYPDNLQAKENSAGFGLNTIEFRNPLNSAVPAEYQLLILPKILANTIGQDFDRYYGMGENTSTVINGPEGNAQQLTKLENKTVSGQRAFTFQANAQPKQPGETPEVGMYIELGDKILIISTAERNQAALNEMLTTFKYPL